MGCAPLEGPSAGASRETTSSLQGLDLSARGPVPPVAYGNLTGNSRGSAQVYEGSAPNRESVASRNGAPVQYADASGEVSPASGGYRLNFENADVSAVCKAILGDILKVNYLVDKRVSGQISLTSSQPLAPAKLVPLLESSLATIGATIVKNDGLYRVVLSADPGGIGAVDYHAAGEGFGTTVIEAKYVPAATLGRLLEGFGSRAGSVRVDPATNFVTVQGTAAERSAAVEAADTVDVDWLRSKSVAILPVANSAPETVISELNRVLDTGEGGLSQHVVQLQPMSRLNAVLAVSRRHDAIDFVRKWVSRLDRVDVAAAGVKVYHLQYAQAKTVAAMLNDTFGGASPTGGDKDPLEPSGLLPTQTNSPGVTSAATLTQPNGAGKSPTLNGALGSQGPFGLLNASFSDPGKQKAQDADAAPANLLRMESGSSRVRVTADVSSNSLFINASALDYKLVERAIRQIDRVPLQVDIEATIAEVTLTKDLQYGIQFFLQSSTGSLGLGGASGVPLTSTFPGLNILSGAAANPRVLLNALQSFTTVNILSSPSLVVLDRQPAVLQVGNQVPILTQQATSVTTVGSPVVNSVEYRDTGVILSVLPRVNANGVVTLDIEQQISAVSSTDPNTLTPTFSQRRVRSSIAVPNGQTVMLAGLISNKESGSRSGIPGLASIQFLSDLLTTHDNTIDRTEIVIFIKPRIITNGADAQQVAQEFRDRLSSMRRELR